MSQRRFLSWSAAMRDICADRFTHPPAVRAARLRHQTFSKVAFERAQASQWAVSLVEAGRYNRRAIMMLAIAAAQSRRALSDESWSICLFAALRGTWQAAKAQRLASQTKALAAPVPQPMASTAERLTRVSSNSSPALARGTGPAPWFARLPPVAGDKVCGAPVPISSGPTALQL